MVAVVLGGGSGSRLWQWFQVVAVVLDGGSEGSGCHCTSSSSIHHDELLLSCIYMP